MLIATLLLFAASVKTEDPAAKMKTAESDAQSRNSEQLVLEHYAEEARRTPAETLKKNSDERLAEWHTCLKEFALKASVVDADTTPVVVDLAFTACKRQRSNAEWAYAQSIMVRSRFKPEMATAYQWAKESFDGFAESSKEGLQVDVSYERQLRHLKNEAAKLRTR